MVRRSENVDFSVEGKTLYEQSKIVDNDVETLVGKDPNHTQEELTSTLGNPKSRFGTIEIYRLYSKERKFDSSESKKGSVERQFLSC